MRPIFSALFLSATLGLGTAHAAGTLSSGDRTFIAKVSQGGMFEVAAGQLGAVQGSTQDIRDQGTTEAHDHALVGAKLKSIAAASGVTFPATLNAQFQQELDALKALSGRALDAAYLKEWNWSMQKMAAHSPRRPNPATTRSCEPLPPKLIGSFCVISGSWTLLVLDGGAGYPRA